MLDRHLWGGTKKRALLGEILKAVSGSFGSFRKSAKTTFGKENDVIATLLSVIIFVTCGKSEIKLKMNENRFIYDLVLQPSIKSQH